MPTQKATYFVGFSLVNGHAPMLAKFLDNLELEIGAIQPLSKLHITASFLGYELTSDHEEKIKQVLDELASYVPAFTIRLGDYGMFEDKPVLFVNVHDDHHILCPLVEKIRSGLDGAQILRFDYANYHPHVTVRKDRSSFKMPTTPIPPGSFRISEIVLFAGVKRKGRTVEYKILHRAPLKEAA